MIAYLIVFILLQLKTFFKSIPITSLVLTKKEPFIFMINMPSQSMGKKDLKLHLFQSLLKSPFRSRHTILSKFQAISLIALNYGKNTGGFHFQVTSIGELWTKRFVSISSSSSKSYSIKVR